MKLIRNTETIFLVSGLCEQIYIVRTAYIKPLSSTKFIVLTKQNSELSDFGMHRDFLVSPTKAASFFSVERV